MADLKELADKRGALLYFEPGKLKIEEGLNARNLASAEVQAHIEWLADSIAEAGVMTASTTLLGGLGASGWQSCCLLMRMICDGFILNSTSMGSPGVEEVRWLKPLRPGTTIRLRSTVTDKRESKSKWDMGLVKFFFEIVDDSDAPLTTLTTTLMFGRREPRP